MNVVIFAIEHTKRPQYLAVCQCGRRHGPYAKVARIPPVCPRCEEQAVATERKVAAHEHQARHAAHPARQGGQYR
jgi:hypothetical protein